MSHLKPILFTTISSAALALSAGAVQAQSSQCGAHYQIERGDTLHAVSQSCRVSLNRIMELNPDLDPRRLEVGTVIRLEANPGSPQDRHGQPDRESYEVREGDTFFEVAQRFGLSLFDLMNENEGTDPWALRPGEEIAIPRQDRQFGFSIEPNVGPPGSPVELEARNLRPGDWVTIGAGPRSSEWQAIDTVQVGSDGRLSAETEVPDWARDGQVLTFVVDTDRGLTLKSNDFEVVDGEDHHGGHDHPRGDHDHDDQPDYGDDDGHDQGERRDIWTLEGEVSQGTECHLLTTRDGDTYSIVSDDIPFTNGEWVRIEGSPADMSFCQQGNATVTVRHLQEVPRD
ncbi:LysM peptidoglycan-binding domain-containing protein [Maricaulis sp. CAU 1757]